MVHILWVCCFRRVMCVRIWFFDSWSEISRSCRILRSSCLISDQRGAAVSRWACRVRGGPAPAVSSQQLLLARRLAPRLRAELWWEDETANLRKKPFRPRHHRQRIFITTREYWTALWVIIQRDINASDVMKVMSTVYVLYSPALSVSPRAWHQ